MTGDTEALGWVEPIKGGGTVWIRLAHPGDADAVAAMHERCSEQSRVHRYFTEVGEWRDINLRRITGGHRGATLVVMSEEGAIIGLGNVFPNAPEDSHAAEFAMIVEDAYQGRGVGTRLQRRMIALAQRLGFTEVVATVLAENSGMLHVLEEPGLQWTREHSQGVITLRAPLPARRPGRRDARRPRTARSPSSRPGTPTAEPPRRKSRVNKAWHQQHVLGSHARLDDRVAWHLAHAKACACRPIPPSIVAAITARGLALPASPASPSPRPERRLPARPRRAGSAEGGAGQVAFVVGDRAPRPARPPRRGQGRGAAGAPCRRAADRPARSRCAGAGRRSGGSPARRSSRPAAASYAVSAAFDAE